MLTYAGGYADMLTYADAARVPAEHGRLVMQVHDEVILEVRRELVRDVASCVRQCMQVP
jgi:DNA polymerase I-like protein with 3'-5' exonuclease and polymerase domains